MTVGSTPRVVHIIWMGSPIPARVEQLRGDIARHDPGVHVRVWTDDDLTWLTHRDLVVSEPQYAAKSDIARYEILLRHGGVYLDADFRVHRSLASVFAGVDAHGLVVARQNPTTYNNAFLAARADHPLLQDLVAGLPDAYRWTARMSAPARTGPFYLTERLLAHLRHGGVAYEIPQHAVYPWYADEEPLPASLLPPAVVMSHEWASISRDWSWARAGVEPESVVIPDRRSRLRRTGRSIRARAAVTPVAHELIGRAERIRLAVTTPAQGRSEVGAVAPTTSVLDGWVAREARRRLRGSACFLDLHPSTALPALAAASSLDRPGRVVIVADPDRIADLPARLWDPSLRPSVHAASVCPDRPGLVTSIRSAGSTLVARTVSLDLPSAEAVLPVDLDLAALVEAVPRYDLARVQADRLAPDVAATIRRMTAQRRIARLIVALDPFAMSTGVDEAIALIAGLEADGLPIAIGPWLVDGRGRTWREHLRVAARPFILTVGP